MTTDTDRTDEMWLPEYVLRELAPEAAQVAKDHGALRDGVVYMGRMPEAYERLLAWVVVS